MSSRLDVKRTVLRTLAIALTLVFAVPALSAEAILTGHAHALDGDTLRIGGVDVRLKGIAAPERGEPGGPEATDAMRRLIGDREVRCELTGERTRGRGVGFCFVGTLDLQAEMARGGYVKACPRYSRRYVTLEREGRARNGPAWRVGYRLPDYCTAR